ncbi:MBL fold metallo-hydrolase, partial [bacterium]|nr:MBL fold metallo-hydrolase [bacterium]
GHSSLLIEIDGRKILTDPIWSKRCSPFSMVGPARFHPPPLSIKSLPALDAVLISHDHFDHLDKATILALAETEAHFYLPLGVGEYLESWGIPADRFTEKDWWEIESLGSDDFTLMATPARHFSGRVTLSGNPTLWTSWTILGPRHRVFFSGDTGWMPVFEKIGNRFGPFDMTMIEIGAYHENWGDIHLGPRQAVDVHLALKGRILLPVHWGTFNLGLHAWNEPIEQLISCASLKSANFVAPQPGQSVSPARLPDLSKWWLKRSA